MYSSANNYEGNYYLESHTDYQNQGYYPGKSLSKYARFFALFVVFLVVVSSFNTIALVDLPRKKPYWTKHLFTFSGWNELLKDPYKLEVLLKDVIPSNGKYYDPLIEYIFWDKVVPEGYAYGVYRVKLFKELIPENYSDGYYYTRFFKDIIARGFRTYILGKPSYNERIVSREAFMYYFDYLFGYLIPQKQYNGYYYDTVAFLVIADEWNYSQIVSLLAQANYYNGFYTSYLNYIHEKYIDNLNNTLTPYNTAQVPLELEQDSSVYGKIILRFTYRGAPVSGVTIAAYREGTTCTTTPCSNDLPFQTTVTNESGIAVLRLPVDTYRIVLGGSAYGVITNITVLPNQTTSISEELARIVVNVSTPSENTDLSDIVIRIYDLNLGGIVGTLNCNLTGMAEFYVIKSRYILRAYAGVVESAPKHVEASPNETYVVCFQLDAVRLTIMVETPIDTIPFIAELRITTINGSYDINVPGNHVYKTWAPRAFMIISLLRIKNSDKRSGDLFNIPCIDYNYTIDLSNYETYDLRIKIGSFLFKPHAPPESVFNVFIYGVTIYEGTVLDTSYYGTVLLKPYEAIPLPRGTYYIGPGLVDYTDKPVPLQLYDLVNITKTMSIHTYSKDLLDRYNGISYLDLTAITADTGKPLNIKYVVSGTTTVNGKYYTVNFIARTSTLAPVYYGNTPIVDHVILEIKELDPSGTAYPGPHYYAVFLHLYLISGERIDVTWCLKDNNGYIDLAATLVSEIHFRNGTELKLFDNVGSLGSNAQPLVQLPFRVKLYPGDRFIVYLNDNYNDNNYADGRYPLEVTKYGLRAYDRCYESGGYYHYTRFKLYNYNTSVVKYTDYIIKQSGTTSYFYIHYMEFNYRNETEYAIEVFTGSDSKWVNGTIPGIYHVVKPYHLRLEAKAVGYKLYDPPLEIRGITTIEMRLVHVFVRVTYNGTGVPGAYVYVYNAYDTSSEPPLNYIAYNVTQQNGTVEFYLVPGQYEFVVYGVNTSVVYSNVTPPTTTITVDLSSGTGSAAYNVSLGQLLLNIRSPISLSLTSLNIMVFGWPSYNGMYIELESLDTNSTLNEITITRIPLTKSLLLPPGHYYIKTYIVQSPYNDIFNDMYVNISANELAEMYIDVSLIMVNITDIYGRPIPRAPIVLGISTSGSEWDDVLVAWTSNNGIAYLPVFEGSYRVKIYSPGTPLDAIKYGEVSPLRTRYISIGPLSLEKIDVQLSLARLVLNVTTLTRSTDPINTPIIQISGDNGILEEIMVYSHANTTIIYYLPAGNYTVKMAALKDTWYTETTITLNGTENKTLNIYLAKIMLNITLPLPVLDLLGRLNTPDYDNNLYKLGYIVLQTKDGETWRNIWYANIKEIFYRFINVSNEPIDIIVPTTCPNETLLRIYYSLDKEVPIIYNTTQADLRKPSIIYLELATLIVRIQLPIICVSSQGKYFEDTYIHVKGLDNQVEYDAPIFYDTSSFTYYSIIFLYRGMYNVSFTHYAPENITIRVAGRIAYVTYSLGGVIINMDIENAMMDVYYRHNDQWLLAKTNYSVSFNEYGNAFVFLTSGYYKLDLKWYDNTTNEYRHHILYVNITSGTVIGALHGIILRLYYPDENSVLNPLIGAIIKFYDRSQGIEFTGKTDEYGTVTVFLPRGKYEVYVSMNGTITYLTMINVTHGATLTYNLASFLLILHDLSSTVKCYQLINGTESYFIGEGSAINSTHIKYIVAPGTYVIMSAAGNITVKLLPGEYRQIYALTKVLLYIKLIDVDNKPISNATVMLYDYSLNKVTIAKTNETGCAVIPAYVTSMAKYAIVLNGYNRFYNEDLILGNNSFGYGLVYNITLTFRNSTSIYYIFKLSRIDVSIYSPEALVSHRPVFLYDVYRKKILSIKYTDSYGNVSFYVTNGTYKIILPGYDYGFEDIKKYNIDLGLIFGCGAYVGAVDINGYEVKHVSYNISSVLINLTRLDGRPIGPVMIDVHIFNEYTGEEIGSYSFRVTLNRTYYLFLSEGVYNVYVVFWNVTVFDHLRAPIYVPMIPGETDPAPPWLPPETPIYYYANWIWRTALPIPISIGSIPVHMEFVREYSTVILNAHGHAVFVLAVYNYNTFMDPNAEYLGRITVFDKTEVLIPYHTCVQFIIPGDRYMIHDLVLVKYKNMDPLLWWDWVDIRYDPTKYGWTPFYRKNVPYYGYGDIYNVWAFNPVVKVDLDIYDVKVFFKLWNESLMDTGSLESIGITTPVGQPRPDHYNVWYKFKLVYRGITETLLTPGEYLLWSPEAGIIGKTGTGNLFVPYIRVVVNSNSTDYTDNITIYVTNVTMIAELPPGYNYVAKYIYASVSYFVNDTIKYLGDTPNFETTVKTIFIASDQDIALTIRNVGAYYPYYFRTSKPTIIIKINISILRVRLITLVRNSSSFPNIMSTVYLYIQPHVLPGDTVVRMIKLNGSYIEIPLVAAEYRYALHSPNYYKVINITQASIVNLTILASLLFVKHIHGTFYRNISAELYVFTYGGYLDLKPITLHDNLTVPVLPGWYKVILPYQRYGWQYESPTTECTEFLLGYTVIETGSLVLRFLSADNRTMIISFKQPRERIISLAIRKDDTLVPGDYALWINYVVRNNTIVIFPLTPGYYYAHLNDQGYFCLFEKIDDKKYSLGWDYWTRSFEAKPGKDVVITIIPGLLRISLYRFETSQPVPNRTITVYIGLDNGTRKGEKICEKYTDENGTVFFDLMPGWYIVDIQDLGTIYNIYISENSITYYRFPVETADLSVEEITVTPSDLGDNQPVLINAYIKNNGPASVVGDFRILFYINNELLGYVPVHGLMNNQGMWVSYPTTVYAGINTIKVIIDEGSLSMLDPNSTNNMLIKTIHVAEPDLVITSMEILNTPIDNALTNISLTIANIGPGSLGRIIEAYVYIDGRWVKKLYIDRLNPGEYRQYNLSLALKGGDHQLKIVIDPFDRVEETNETNNVYIATISVQPADLSVSAHLQYDDLVDGASAKLIVNVTNNGPGDTMGVIHVHVYIDSGYYTSLINYKGLKAGKNIVFTTKIRLMGGTHKITVVVDPLHVIGDLNRTNNKYTITYYVPAPDLEIKLGSYNPTIIGVGTYVAIKYVLRNIGDGPVKHRIMVMLYINNTPAVIRYPITGRAFNPGETYTGTIYISISETGIYQLKLVVDPWKEIGDINRTNNIVVFIIRVLPCDISILGAKLLDNTSLVSGEYARLRIRLTNYGPGPVDIPFYISFFEKIEDGGKHNPEYEFVKQVKVDGIGVNEIKTIEVMVPIHAGNRSLIIVADDHYVRWVTTATIPFQLKGHHYETPDLFRVNNEYVIHYYARGPDLYIRDISLINGSDVCAWGKATLRIIIGNKGDYPVSNVSFTIYVDLNPINGSYLWKEVAMVNNTVYPGEELSYNISLDYILHPGRNRIFIYVDSFNTIYELNESNNFYEKIIDLGYPDLTIRNVYYNWPSTVNASTLYQIYVEIHNKGNSGYYREIPIMVVDPSSNTVYGVTYINQTLRPGDNVGVYINVTMLPPGGRDVYVIVDFYNEVPESNESNNAYVIHLPRIRYLQIGALAYVLWSNITKYFNIVLRNLGSATLKITSISIEGINGLSLDTPLPLILSPNMQYKIRVYPNYNLIAPGIYDATLRIETNTTEYCPVYQLAVYVLDPEDIPPFRVTMVNRTVVSLNARQPIFFTISSFRYVNSIYKVSFAGNASSMVQMINTTLPGAGHYSFTIVADPALVDSGRYVLYVNITLPDLFNYSIVKELIVDVIKYPEIYVLYPANNTNVSAPTTKIIWLSNIYVRGTIYIKPVNTPGAYSEIQVLPGYYHEAVVGGLISGLTYEYYIEISTPIGVFRTPKLYFTAKPAVVFSSPELYATIYHDYGQTLWVNIRNNDLYTNHTIVAYVINPYYDIIADFIGKGSLTDNRPITIRPETEAKLLLLVHAADAMRPNYTILLVLKDLCGGGTSVATLTLYVKRPSLDNIELHLMGLNPYTMTFEYELVNNGEAISDLYVDLSGPIKKYVMVYPLYSHVRLGPGQGLTFYIVPAMSRLLDNDFSKLKGELIVYSASLQKYKIFPIDLSSFLRNYTTWKVYAIPTIRNRIVFTWMGQSMLAPDKMYWSSAISSSINMGIHGSRLRTEFIPIPWLIPVIAVPAFITIPLVAYGLDPIEYDGNATLILYFKLLKYGKPINLYIYLNDHLIYEARNYTPNGILIINVPFKYVILNPDGDITTNILKISTKKLVCLNDSLLIGTGGLSRSSYRTESQAVVTMNVSKQNNCVAQLLLAMMVVDIWPKNLSDSINELGKIRIASTNMSSTGLATYVFAPNLQKAHEYIQNTTKIIEEFEEELQGLNESSMNPASIYNLIFSIKTKLGFKYVETPRFRAKFFLIIWLLLLIILLSLWRYIVPSPIILWPWIFGMHKIARTLAGNNRRCEPHAPPAEAMRTSYLYAIVKRYIDENNEVIKKALSKAFEKVKKVYDNIPRAKLATKPLLWLINYGSKIADKLNLKSKFKLGVPTRSLTYSSDGLKYTVVIPVNVVFYEKDLLSLGKMLGVNSIYVLIADVGVKLKLKYKFTWKWDYTQCKWKRDSTSIDVEFALDGKGPIPVRRNELYRWVIIVGTCAETAEEIYKDLRAIIKSRLPGVPTFSLSLTFTFDPSKYQLKKVSISADAGVEFEAGKEDIISGTASVTVEFELEHDFITKANSFTIGLNFELELEILGKSEKATYTYELYETPVSKYTDIYGSSTDAYDILGVSSSSTSDIMYITGYDRVIVDGGLKVFVSVLNNNVSSILYRNNNNTYSIVPSVPSSNKSVYVLLRALNFNGRIVLVYVECSNLSYVDVAKARIMYTVYDGNTWTQPIPIITLYDISLCNLWVLYGNDRIYVAYLNESIIPVMVLIEYSLSERTPYMYTVPLFSLINTTIAGYTITIYNNNIIATVQAEAYENISLNGTYNITANPITVIIEYDTITSAYFVKEVDIPTYIAMKAVPINNSLYLAYENSFGIHLGILNLSTLEFIRIVTLSDYNDEHLSDMIVYGDSLIITTYRDWDPYYYVVPLQLVSKDSLIGNYIHTGRVENDGNEAFDLSDKLVVVNGTPYMIWKRITFYNNMLNGSSIEIYRLSNTYISDLHIEPDNPVHGNPVDVYVDIVNPDNNPVNITLHLLINDEEYIKKTIIPAASTTIIIFEDIVIGETGNVTIEAWLDSSPLTVSWRTKVFTTIDVAPFLVVGLGNNTFVTNKLLLQGNISGEIAANVTVVVSPILGESKTLYLENVIGAWNTTIDLSGLNDTDVSIVINAVLSTGISEKYVSIIKLNNRPPTLKLLGKDLVYTNGTVYVKVYAYDYYGLLETPTIIEENGTRYTMNYIGNDMYEAVFSIAGYPEGKKVYIEIKATDTGGLVSSVKMIVIPDYTAPTTIPSIENGTWVASGLLRFSAVDNISGLNTTYVSIDNGTWVETTSIDLSDLSEGIHTIRYYSVDNAGNKEGVKEIIIGIDRTPPIIQVQGLIDNAIVAGTLNIGITASDNLSGIKKIVYSLDEGIGGTIYTSESVNTTLTIDTTQLSDGRHTLNVTVIDRAGNAKSIAVGFIVDNTPPQLQPVGSTTITVPVNTSVSISWYVFDPHLSTVLLLINNTIQVNVTGLYSYTIDPQLLQLGTNNITIIARDEANNTATLHYKVIVTTTSGGGGEENKTSGENNRVQMPPAEEPSYLSIILVLAILVYITLHPRRRTQRPV